MLKTKPIDALTPDWVSDFLNSNFPGLSSIYTWGEKSFFYNPENLLKRGIYFCTLKEKDGANDQSSDLNRTDVFRVNFGISKPTFLNIFGIMPQRPAKGTCIEGHYDFTALDTLTPHPVYGWMAWVSILNPSAYSWNNIQGLVQESYQLSLKKYAKQLNKKASHSASNH
ncbi:MAG TPA: DUF6194 family protein [Opitutales bacterium]|nr:DUF6194 family protein [Opitutales bacterium]